MGIDFGTNGVRVGIVDCNGEILVHKETFYATKFEEEGSATQNCNDWIPSFYESAGYCLDKLSEAEKQRLSSAAVCATSSTVLLIDSNGNPLTDAFLWMDTRSKHCAKRINDTKHPVLKYCGGEVSPEWLVPKVLWLKENYPDEYNKCYKAVDQIDYINYFLTGNLAASKCNAVCKWNYVDGEGFNQEFLDLIGLPDFEEKVITNVLPVGQEVGTLRSEIAQRLGIPEIKIYMGGIDAHIAMIGMGVVEPNQMAMIMGTSFVQFVLAEKPMFIDGIWGPYVGALGEGFSLIECGQISAGSIIKWFYKTFDMSGEDIYATMIQEAEKVPIGANGIRALDFFQGNRTPYKNTKAKGCLNGLTLNHTKADIYRALIESVALGTKNIVVNLAKSGVAVKGITGCGGVTKDRLWMQIISDCTGLPIYVNKHTSNGGILGAAILCACSDNTYDSFVEAAKKMTHKLHVVEPNMNNFELYNNVYEDYIKLYLSLYGGEVANGR